MGKIADVQRTFKELKLDLSWLDDEVDNACRLAANRACNSNKRISFLLEHGYTVKELQALGRSYAQLRKNRIMNEMEHHGQKKEKRGHGRRD